MTNAQLEHVVIVQARELGAQRRVIERQQREIRKRKEAKAHAETDYRRGYRAGRTAGKRERMAA